MVTGPLTPGAGKKLSVPSPLSVTEPWAGLASTGALTVSCAGVLSTSVSLALTLKLSSGVLIGVLGLSSTATGASLVPVTVMLSVVVLLAAPRASLRV